MKDWGLDLLDYLGFTFKRLQCIFVGEQFQTFEEKHFRKRLDNHYSLQNLSDVYLGSDEI